MALVMMACSNVVSPIEEIPSIQEVQVPKINGQWDVTFYTNVENDALFVFSELDSTTTMPWLFEGGTVIGTLIDNLALGYFVGKWNGDQLRLEKTEADWTWKLEAYFNADRTHFKGKWHIYHKTVYKDYHSIWGWKQ